MYSLPEEIVREVMLLSEGDTIVPWDKVSSSIISDPMYYVAKIELEKGIRLPFVPHNPREMYRKMVAGGYTYTDYDVIRLSILVDDNIYWRDQLKMLKVLANKGDIEYGRLLIDRVDPDILAVHGISQVIVSEELIMYILNDPRIDISKTHPVILGEACKYGHVEVVRTLLARTNMDPGAGNCIKNAVYNGHTEIVRLLLRDRRADPSMNNNYCIKKACLKGYTEIVELLLRDPRVDPTVENNYYLRKARLEGHDEIVRLLFRDPRVRRAAANKK